MKWYLTTLSFSGNLYIQKDDEKYYLIVPGPDGDFGDEITEDLANSLIKELGCK
jgi:hypothetical protein